MESDLERIIHSKQPLTDQHYQYFLYQILRGLKYIHSANVLHRDLKPSNLIVNSNCDLALCDFGLARGFNIDGDEELTEYVVTRWYRAPELLCLSSKYGKSVDIWSVGCIFAEMLTHTVFFRGDNPSHQLELIIAKLGCPSRSKLDFVSSQQMLDVIMQYEAHVPSRFDLFFPRNVNPLALDLLYRMLAFHPDERCSVVEALNHPYLREFHASMTEPDCSRNFDFAFEVIYLYQHSFFIIFILLYPSLSLSDALLFHNIYTYVYILHTSNQYLYSNVDDMFDLESVGFIY